ncbi:MAG: divergent PAP2 family protein [Negativicutes bacterium]|jgi:hypothetical protein
MHNFSEFWANGVLWCAIISWAIAQLLKVFFDYARNGCFDATRLVGTGGMPSSHTALVVALTAAVGIKCGFASPDFAVAAILSAVVMYDATGIRRAAGRQATALNKIIKEMTEGHPVKEVHLKELLGHTPVEVIAGAVLGVVVALVLQYIGWL